MQPEKFWYKSPTFKDYGLMQRKSKGFKDFLNMIHQIPDLVAGFPSQFAEYSRCIPKILLSSNFNEKLIWEKVFKNGTSKICGRQPQ